MTANFYESIYETLQQQPANELIVWPNGDGTSQSYTGRAILDRITTISHGLSRKGVKPGQPVLLALPVSFELICTLLAIMAVGAMPVLPPAAASLRTLLALTVGGDNKTVVIQRKINPVLAWLVSRLGIRLIRVDAITTLVPGAGQLPQPVEPEQPALISHSSGSTGQPKSIRRSHRVLLAQHLALKTSFPPWPGQRDFPLFPNVLLHNLAAGTVSILPDLPGFKVTRMAPARICQQLVDQRVQTLTGNVYYMQHLLNYLAQHPQMFPAVRAVGIGGSPVPESLVQALKQVFSGAEIYIIYGASEAEPIAIRQVSTGSWPARSGYAVGTVHPAIQLRISFFGAVTGFDGTARMVGEIEVKGAHVATAGEGWLQTGDFGYLDEQNGLFLTGRKGNERLHRGVQHYQIEHVLLTVAGVVRAAARATETGFTVYIEGKATEADLWQVLADNFPAGLVDRILFRKALPVDARHHSKIRYDQLTTHAFRVL